MTETLHDETLRLLSDSLDDLETLRKAVGNRFGTMTRGQIDEETGERIPDSDGIVRGHGLSLHDPEVQQMKVLFEGIETFERAQIRQLEKRVMAGAFGPFIDSVPGLGAKTAARLISVIGDPYLRPIFEGEGTARQLVGYAPRTVSQLWAYCGYSVQLGIAQRRRKGEQANWNATAKMRAFLVAETIIKKQVSNHLPEKERGKIDAAHPHGYDPEIRYATGKYGEIYLAERVYQQGAIHGNECPQCGGKGPAEPAGSLLKKSHQAQRATRKVTKELLKDLWVEARRLHGVVDVELAAA